MPSHPLHHLDLRGLKCPMPVIKTQQAARQLAADSLLEVIVTDPAAEKDLASWCRINKHQFLSCERHPDLDTMAWIIKLHLKNH